MSNVIKVLEKNIETLEMLEKEYEKRATPRMKFASIRSALNNAVISLKKTKDRYSEELAKEPQECNSDLINRKKLIEDLFYSADGNRYPTRDCDDFPITISFEDLRKAINNQQQVQPIVRTAEEIVEMLNRISCPECDRNSSHCHFSETDCKNYWFEWLTKSEV